MRLCTVDVCGSQSPAATAFVATGAGLVFTVVGVLLVTDYKGARRWILDRAEESLNDVSQVSAPLRRFNIRVFHGGDSKRFEYHKAHVMPVIVGGAFMVMGGIALLIGLVGLIALLVKAL